MKNIAIIPARSGSKGLKDKNIKELNGKPMMAYSIEAALQSEKYDCVHVSTDSERYARIAEEYGAEQLFLRAPELADDTSDTWDVVRWTLDKYREYGKDFDTVTVLQPTSPLRKAEDICNVFQILDERQADAVISVCETDHSPLLCNVLPKDGSMNQFIDESVVGRRQELPVYYRINGAVYLLRTSLFHQETLDLYDEKTYSYIMPKERSIDIDDKLDFVIAETLMKALES